MLIANLVEDVSGNWEEYATVPYGDFVDTQTDSTPNNDDRAEWGLIAVQAFADATGLDIAPDADGLETAISDMLADVMHLCRREGVSFTDCMYRGAGHHAIERDGTEL